MMPCSKEALLRLFYNFSSFFQLLFLFLYFSSSLLSKLFHFISCNFFISQRAENEVEYGWYSEEEEGNGYIHEECNESDDLVENINHGEHLTFSWNSHQNIVDEGTKSFREPVYDEDDQDDSQWPPSVYGSPAWESVIVEDVVDEEDFPEREVDSVYTPCLNKASKRPTSSTIIELSRTGLVTHQETHHEACTNAEKIRKEKLETENLCNRGDENFLVFGPSELHSKKFQARERSIVNEHEDIFGDSCTVGSTSKSSSEWRSSIFNRDSGTDDPFSSSSRRSCPKWESYTVFQKYDEEMIFLDRISAQKLQETESFRSIQACPRSISERIIHKFATKGRRRGNNPYDELEAAYVAQICLTWEALNWNYINFQNKRALNRQSDRGCPARVAQEFQQFQVLLQRFIENEPYEHGKRPEVYARIRKMAQKLLLVPEYRDSEDEQNEEAFGSRISSTSFLHILEDGIRTFMNFLKADRENPCQAFKSLFTTNRSGSVDPTMLLLFKKAHKKKKIKLEDLRRAGKCLRKRKLREGEEMQILMGLIDLKVVSRVLRMADLSEEQLQWCEHKMGKLRVLGGKLQRDSTPLFFPAH